MALAALFGLSGGPRALQCVLWEQCHGQGGRPDVLGVWYQSILIFQHGISRVKEFPFI